MKQRKTTNENISLELPLGIHAKPMSFPRPKPRKKVKPWHARPYKDIIPKTKKCKNYSAVGPTGTYPAFWTRVCPSGETMKSTIFRTFSVRGFTVTMYAVAISG